MTQAGGRGAAHTGRVLKALGWLEIDDEVEAAFSLRSNAQGLHPSRWAIEAFVCRDIVDDRERAALAAHIMNCATCRAERNMFVSLLREAVSARPSETGPNSEELRSQVLRLRAPGAVPPAGRVVIALAGVAAAAGGAVFQRTAPGVTIRLASLSELSGQVVVAIMLENRALRPRLLRLYPPGGPPYDEDLPAPDEEGLIQFIKHPARHRDRLFLDLIRSVPLEFLDPADDQGDSGAS